MSELESQPDSEKKLGLVPVQNLNFQWVSETALQRTPVHWLCDVNPDLGDRPKVGIAGRRKRVKEEKEDSI